MKPQHHKIPMLLLAAAISQNALALVTARNDFATTAVNTPVAIDALANDSSDEETFFTFTNNTGGATAAGGTVEVDFQTRTLLYTPAPGFTGTDTFTYDVAEQSGYGDPVTATVTVIVGGATSAAERAQVALANACGNTTSPELAATCDVYESLSLTDQQRAIEQILPTQVPAQMEGVFIQQNQIFQNLRNRLRALRSGAQGLSLNGFSVKLRDGSIPLGSALQSGTARHIDSDDEPGSDNETGSAGDTTAFADTPWGIFVSGRINDGKIDQRDDQRGFDFRTDTVTAGIDYRLRDSLVLGAAIGYSSSSNDFVHNTGDLDLKSWNLSLYGNFYPVEHWYVDWVVGYSRNDYDGKRRIQFGSIDSSAKFDSDGHQYSAGASTGYEWNYQAWQYSGYVRADYVKSEIDGYAESGGAGLALRVADQSARSLEGGIGARLSYAWSFSKGVLVPGIDAELVHQFKDDQRAVKVAFVDAPDAGEFGLETSELDSTYFNIGLSLTGAFTGGKSAYVRYETAVGRNDVRDNTIEAGVRLEF